MVFFLGGTVVPLYETFSKFIYLANNENVKFEVCSQLRNTFPYRLGLAEEHVKAKHANFMKAQGFG